MHLTFIWLPLFGWETFQSSRPLNSDMIWLQISFWRADPSCPVLNWEMLDFRLVQYFYENEKYCIKGKSGKNRYYRIQIHKSGTSTSKGVAFKKSSKIYNTLLKCLTSNFWVPLFFSFIFIDWFEPLHFFFQSLLLQLVPHQKLLTVIKRA